MRERDAYTEQPVCVDVFHENAVGLIQTTGLDVAE